MKLGIVGPYGLLSSIISVNFHRQTFIQRLKCHLALTHLWVEGLLAPPVGPLNLLDHCEIQLLWALHIFHVPRISVAPPFHHTTKHPHINLCHE